MEKGFTATLREEMHHIANALEHIAYPPIVHIAGCDICAQMKKPIKKMPQSVVMNPAQLAKREADIRTQKMLHGPEEPIHDMFRYRELNPKS